MVLRVVLANPLTTGVHLQEILAEQTEIGRELVSGKEFARGKELAGGARLASSRQMQKADIHAPVTPV